MITRISPASTQTLTIESFVTTCTEQIYRTAKAIVQLVVNRMFYNGFKVLDPAIAQDRRHSLFTKYGAQEFTCSNKTGTPIDAVYIPSRSSSRTGNVIVLCLNTTFQDHHPSHLEPFLENGSDILVWNPTQLGPIHYSDDLSCILKLLRAQQPEQKIVLKTYCASSDPAIRAAADLKDPNIHLIIDRGHGNVQGLTASFNPLAWIPIVQTVLEETFNCHGAEKIKSIQGRMLFLTPDEIDQVMDHGKKRNFTRDLHSLRPEQSLVELKSKDHWSKWDFTTYNSVFSFLAEIGVIAPSYKPATEIKFPSTDAPSCFARKCIPILTKPCSI